MQNTLYDTVKRLSLINDSRDVFKVHKSWDKLGKILEIAPKNIEDNGWTDPPQCMPDHCKDDDVVRAYRNYYILEKNNFAVWKHSGTPEWYTKGMSHANV